MRTGGLHDIKSSLPLEISLYFHRFYAPAFFAVTLLLLIYKAIMLPYPKAAIGLEVTFVFLYLFVEHVRLYLASRGNKTEAITPSLSALLLSALIIIFHVYYLRLQTYVLRLDQIINGIALAFVIFEVLAGGLTILRFIQAQRF